MATLALVAGCQKSAEVPPPPAAVLPGGAAVARPLTPAEQAAVQRADQQGAAIHAANAPPGGN